MARILVVDDDETLRTTLVQTLSSIGHAVQFAGNGFDAATMFRKEPTDLILIDINMPYGGLQTIRVLRAEFPKLAIIAMSGNQPQLNLAGATGANRILPKPFTFPQLTDAIAEVLGPAGATPAPPV
jgi:two-component system response regulator PrrA